MDDNDLIYQGTGKLSGEIIIRNKTGKGHDTEILIDGIRLNALSVMIDEIKPNEQITATCKLLVKEIEMPIKELKIDAFTMKRNDDEG